MASSLLQKRLDQEEQAEPAPVVGSLAEKAQETNREAVESAPAGFLALASSCEKLVAKLLVDDAEHIMDDTFASTDPAQSAVPALCEELYRNLLDDLQLTALRPSGVDDWANMFVQKYFLHTESPATSLNT